MAYQIVRRLRDMNQTGLIKQLSSFVNLTERRQGKLHEVFEPSFDWKKCIIEKFIEQKLEYIHNNPCQGNWNLAVDPWDYEHCSAQFYFCHKQGVYPVTSYSDLEDIDLTIPLTDPGTDTEPKRRVPETGDSATT